MGKRSAVVELFLGDMGSMQRESRPSIQREDQPTMETKLEQIAVKAVNQLPKSVVREIRTPRSVGAGGGQLPPATRWARGNSRPYRESGQRWSEPTRLPSRPGEFRPEPLTDPDLMLSHHPARATARRLPPSAEPSGSSWHRQLAQAQRR